MARVKTSPLLLGLSGILGSLAVLIIGGLTLRGYLVSDGQKQLLSLGDKTLPYLKAAEIAAKSNDYVLAEKLAAMSSVLGLSTDQEDMIWPENKIKLEIDELKEQIKETPSAYLWLRVAYDQYRIKEFEAAKESITKAEKIAPNDEQVKKFILWFSLQQQ